MSTPPMVNIDQYLAALRKACKGIQPAACDEFVQEIHSHILDRLEVEGDHSEAVVSSILSALGDPRVLAKQFTTDALLQRATRTISPWLILRGLARWSTAGVAGLLVFVATLFGYGLAVICFLCLILKPFIPDHIGLWLSPNTLTLGYWDGDLANSLLVGTSVRPPIFCILGTLGPTNGPVHELAGVWIYAICAVGAGLSLVATRLFAQWMIRRFGLKKDIPTTPSPRMMRGQSGYAG
jgi:hypothetical protein